MNQEEKNQCSQNCDCSCQSSDKSSDASCDCGQSNEGADLQVNFFNYIMSMAYQAMIFLGEVPNPITNKEEVNLRQAKFLIDTLQLIKEKTKGNLTPQEDHMIASSLSELQLKYVDASKKQ